MGLLAGFWAALAPLLVFLPIYENASGETGLSASAAGRLGGALAVLLPACGLGILTVVATGMLVKGRAWAQYVLMAVAVGLLALTVLSAGPFLFGPALLTVVAALWLRPAKRA